MKCHFLLALHMWFFLAACTSTLPPTPTRLPTGSAATGTATSTEVAPLPPDPSPTPEPTIGLPTLRGIPPPSEDLMQSAMEPYVHAMGLEPGTVQPAYEELRDIHGLPFVVALDSQKMIPLLIAVQNTATGEWQWQAATLRGLADRLDFHVGANVQKEQLPDARYVQILATQFNGVNVSQGMYWKWLEPERGVIDYRYNVADTEQQLEVIRDFDDPPTITGMHILFPQTYPDWLANGSFSQGELVEILSGRVRFLIERYGDDITRWVVVNEPYFDGRSVGMDFIRHDALQEQLGPEYMRMAFEIAREAAGPEAVLLYNDTANHSLDPSDWINGLYTGTTLTNLERLDGLVDIVGLQMHLDAATPPQRDDLIRTMQTYAPYANVGVEITELDVDLSNLPFDMPWDEKFRIQAEIYAEVLEACFASGVCVGLNVWDIGDHFTWLEVYRGRTDAEPTLWDDDYQPKQAYYALLRVLYQRLAD